jgi:hypothetical protein
LLTSFEPEVDPNDMRILYEITGVKIKDATKEISETDEENIQN